jgi:hypothetical protein
LPHSIEGNADVEWLIAEVVGAFLAS